MLIEASGFTKLPANMSLNKYSSNIFVFMIIMANTFPLFARAVSFKLPNFLNNQSQLALEGDAMLMTSGGIQLNKEEYYRVGRVSYSEPLQLWNSSTMAEASFTTRFSFTIDTEPSSKREPTGDGLVFFLAPLDYGPIPPNSGGCGFGLLNSTTISNPTLNKVIMVEFDTYPNHHEVTDTTQQHVGINKNSIDSMVTRNWNASSHMGKPADVLISYNASSNNLSVFWNYDQEEEDSLSCILDLKKELPERVFVGFSASTGYRYETHIINSWEFKSNLEVVGNNKNFMSNKNLRGGIIVAILCVFVIGLGMMFWFMRKKKMLTKNKKTDLASVSKIDLERAADLPKQFSYQELETATNCFADDRRLGRGGSGQVYKATLNDVAGRIVAVKRIFGEYQQSERIFINEVNIISRLMHRNLVKFIGWCHEQKELLLVYEYMPNGSLDAHLFGERKSLPWDVRYKIAKGLAYALHYLHEEAANCVLHRDIKSANVLLDTDFSAKLGDFGVAKLVDSRLRTQMTALVGTFGYLAPEYLAEGRATKESDMYSFGVVALEIACGRKTYQAGEYDHHLPLMRWVWELYLEGKIMEAVDERLDMEFVQNEMRLLLMVGLWCCHPREKQRPKASQVIRVLQFNAQLPELDPAVHQEVSVTPQEVSGSLHIEITSSIRNEGR